MPTPEEDDTRGTAGFPTSAQQEVFRYPPFAYGSLMLD